MASACINTISLSPATYSSYSCFNPRLKVGREMLEESASKSNTKRISSPEKNSLDLLEKSDLKDFEDQEKVLSDLQEDSSLNDFDGFEFRLDDQVMMLPADELFSNGKLVPSKLSVVRQEVATSTTTIISDVTSPDTSYSLRRKVDRFAVDPYLISPRAPRCSSRWKELLGFGKLYQNNTGKVDNINNKRTTSLPSSHTGTVTTGATRSIRQLLHRSSKSHDSSVNLPLLKDLDSESASISSRPSLSSSSSGHDLDDLQRLSLDSDKPSKVQLNTNRPKTRMVKTRERRVTTRVGRTTAHRSADATVATDRGLSIDSPRMNSSGKIVFHSLERSCSSPSSLNGGPRFKHTGMERSYSANVRVTPVLNVPVCSIRGSSKSGGMFGFPIFTTHHKREGSSSNTNGGQNRSQRFVVK